MRKQIATTLCLLAATTAAADPQRGGYAKALGGLGTLGSTGLDSSGQDAKLDFDAGFGAGIAGGFDFGRLRLEGEYLYQTNDTDSLSGTGLPAGSEPGDFSSVAVSGSVIAEFNLLQSDRAISYLGAGVVWLQEVDLDFETSAGELSYSNDAIAYQILAGVEYRLNPRWTAGAELRYLSAGEVTLDGEGNATGSIKADYERTSLLFSIGYRF